MAFNSTSFNANLNNTVISHSVGLELAPLHLQLGAYHQVFYEAFIYWLFIAFVNTLVIIGFHFRARAQISGYIDKGVALLTSIPIENVPYQPTTAIPDPDTWEPKTSLGCLGLSRWWLFNYFDLLPLIIYLAMHYIVQGPQLGYLFLYSVCLLPILIVGTRLLWVTWKVLKRGLEFFEGVQMKTDNKNKSVVVKMCEELWAVTGMDSEKLTTSFVQKEEGNGIV